MTTPGSCEPDPKETVRRGYDALSLRYRADDADEGRYGPWLAELRAGLPAGGTVLDLGCGCGVPVARSLSDHGYAVTGVDFSRVQIDRARVLVPGAAFLEADITAVDFPAASFDAVVCFYALIHLPLAEQPPLLGRVASWLRPGGRLVATVGHRAWTGGDDGWLGGDAAMWWSHTDAAGYREWITAAGLTVEHEEFVPEGGTGHTLFRARRP